MTDSLAINIQRILRISARNFSNAPGTSQKPTTLWQAYTRHYQETVFYQRLQVAISQLTDDDIRLVMIRSANWLKEAK